MSSLGRLWQRLTDVPAEISDRGSRRQAHLLAAATLLLVLLGFVAILIEALLVSHFLPTFVATAGGLVALLFAYALARTGRYRIGAVIAVTVVVIIGFDIVLFNPNDSFPNAFLIFGPFLAALFFPGTGVVVTTAVVLTGVMLVLPAVGVRPPDGDPVVGPIFLTIVGALLVLYSRHRDAVERDRQAELAASEEQFRSLAEAAHEGIVFAENGRIIEINARGATMLGAPRDAIIGRSVLDFCAPEFYETVMQHIRSGSEETYEVIGRRADGSPFPQELRGQQTVYQGRPVRVTVFRDLTERRRAEEALRASEARYRNIVETAQEGVWQIDPNDRTTFVNKKMADMLGTTVEDMQGQSIYAFMDEEGQALVGRKLERRRRGIAEQYESRFRRKDGVAVWLLLSSSPITDAHGGYAGSFAMVTDITERKNAEQRIIHLNRLLRTIGQARQMMVREHSRERLLSETCRILVEHGEYRMVWIGLADFSSGVVKPVAHAGTESDYLDSVEIRCDDSPLAHGPTGTAIRENRCVVNTDTAKAADFGPWRENASRLHFLSSIAIPLRIENEVIGAVNVYADTVAAFGQDEIALLDGLADDLGYALQALDVAAARARAEQALAQSEANFRTLTENANVGIMVNYQGKHVFANKRMLDMLGYTMDQFRETGIRELVHPDQYEKVMRRYRDRHAGKAAPLIYETVFVTRDGKPVPVELTNALTTWQGEPATLVFLHDISERVRAVEALRRSEQHLRSVVSNVPVVFFTLDRDGVFTLSEGKGLDSLGLRPGEVVGQSVFDMYADYPDIANSVRRALAGESLRATNKVGQLIFDTWYSPLRDSHGEVAGTIGVAMDVSERVRAAEALRQSEERLRKVFEATATSISITRRSDGLFLDANQTLFDMTGWTREEVIGHTAQELNMWVDPGMREKLLGALVDRRAVRNMDWQVRCKSGRILSVLGSIETIKIADTDCLLIISQDITDRKHTEEAMNKLSSALEQTADSVLITDRQGVIEYVNPAFERTTGFRRDEALGQTPRLVKSGKQGPGFYRKLWETILAGETFSDVFINRRKDGNLYYEEKTVTPLKDLGGMVTHFVSTGKDVTERMQTQERLQYMAQHDALTDLPNRALLLDRLKQSLARARWRQRLVAVLFVDMDRFKTINDTLGHEVGDQVLQQLAERFQQSVREGDTVARFGGDEFVVLLDDVASDKDVGHIAQKVLEALEPPFEVAGQRLYITASIGVTIFPNDGEDSSTLLRNADIAMYRAKELGKNTWQMYSADMSARAFERMTLESSLRHALERNEFRLHYQPQVDVETGAIIGVEALLRWQHPDFGLVLPNDFIPLLEETGLIVATGEWVLSTACAQLGAWRAAGWNDLRLAVNLSPRQFHAQNLRQIVERAINSLGGEPGSLEFEITEGILLQHAGATLSTLEAMRALGVRLAIDDFGTGYSSLSYLRRFPIDTLKIDRTFVHDVPGDPDDSAITAAIIVLAKTLKLNTVAEGVETAAQRDFLRAQGCRYMQGSLFSRPLVVEDLTRLLEAQPKRS
jgi:diguanylate cyclase (GGDEF)-like protein/PAS domain S-box-containing protein